MFDTTGSDNRNKQHNRTFADVHADTLTNGGGTFDIATLESVSFADGYIVGVGNLGIETEAQFTIGQLGYIVDRARVCGVTGLFGTWIDGETVYVDRVVYTPFDVIARELQRISSELCVYDCKAGESIDLLAGE